MSTADIDYFALGCAGYLVVGLWCAADFITKARAADLDYSPGQVWFGVWLSLTAWPAAVVPPVHEVASLVIATGLAVGVTLAAALVVVGRLAGWQ